MTNISSNTDISDIATRRKALGVSAFSALWFTVLAVLSSIWGLLGYFPNRGIAFILFLVLGVGALWPTLRLLRRLPSSGRRMVWAVAAAELAFLIVVLVGFPLQAVGAVDSPALAAMMGFQAGIGEEFAQTLFCVIVLLPTTAVVFAASDSVALSRHLRHRTRRRLAAIPLAAVTFMAVVWVVVAYVRRVPSWGWAVAFVDVPFAVALIPGLYVLLTERPRVVNGMRLPAAIEQMVPKSARRVLRGRGTRSAGWLRMIFLLLATGVALTLGPWARGRFHPEQLPSQFMLEIGLTADAVASELVLGMGFTLAAVVIGRAVRAREMPTAEELFARDQRPRILYLRSFLDDDVRIRTRRSERRNYLENLASILLRLMFVRMKERFEQVLVWQLWHLGPVIAVGEPVRRPYRLGSPRLYIPQAYWQSQIQELMRSARFVVVVLGRTEGLAWELQCLGRLGLARKMLLVLPPVGERELRTRAQTLGELAALAGLPQPPLDAFNDTLCAVLAPDGTSWRTFSGRHRDEWYYEVAIESAVESLDTDAVEHLARTREGARRATTATSGVAESIKRLRSEDPAAVQLLEIGAFLAPEPIPLGWFKAATPSLPSPLAEISATSSRLEATMRRINDYALARAVGGSFQLYPLVRSALRDSMSPTHSARSASHARALLSWAAGVTRGEYEEESDNDVDGWPDVSDTDTWPLLGSILSHARTVPEDYREFRYRSLMLLLSAYLGERGDYQGNLDLARALYAGTEAVAGLTDQERLRYVRDFGIASLLAGEAERGLELTQREYHQRLDWHGRDDPGALGAAINVALCLDKLGRDEEALALGADTLARQTRVLGPDHIGTLNSAHGQAHRLERLGQLTAAAELLEETWARRVAIQGREHLDSLNVERCLARMLARGLDVARANQLAREVHATYGKVLGVNDRNSIQSALELAGYLKILGHNGSARRLVNDALARSKATFGPDSELARSAAALSLELRRRAWLGRRWRPRGAGARAGGR